MALTPDQRKEILFALRDAFDTASLAILTSIHLNVELDKVVRPGNFDSVAHGLIKWAEQNGRERDLIAAAVAERYRNGLVKKMGAAWGIAPPEDGIGPADPRFPVRYGVSALPPYYVARTEELVRLDAALAQLEVALTALEGMGGVGKSTLALAYCHSAECAERFPDGVLWGRLGPEASNDAYADAALLAWGEALRLDRDAFARVAPADKAAMLCRVLADRRVLLVVDDMWHAPPARLLQVARGANCAVLLTTRSKALAVALEAEPLDLDTLTEDEALQLLAKRMRRALRPDEIECARELAKRVGFHPLAVQLAGAQLRLPGRSWNGILGPLRAQQGTIAPTIDNPLDLKSKESSIARCFDWSYNALEDGAQAGFRRLSVLAPEAPFELEDAAALWGDIDEPLAADDTQHMLNTLVDAALLEAVEKKAGICYRQHLLLRDDAQRRLKAAGEFDAALLHHARVYVAIVDGAAQVRTYEPIERTYAQVEAVLRRAWRALRPTPDDTGSGPAYAPDVAWEFFNTLCSNCHNIYWSMAGRPWETLRWLPRAGAVVQGHGTEFDEGVHLLHLGQGYADLGQVKKAINLYEQALAIAQEIRDRHLESRTIGNLGNAYLDLARVEKAIHYYEQGLMIARETGDRRGEGARLGNLGRAHAVRGRIDEAILYYQQALAIAREVGDRRREGARLGNLGDAYTDLRESKLAIGFFEQALAIAREIGDRRGEGDRLVSLGSLYRNLGSAEEGIGYYEKALAIQQEIGDRRGQAKCLSGLATAHRNQGCVEEAIRIYEQALAIHREIGDRHMEGIDLGNIGTSYRKQGLIQKAVCTYEQALAIHREVGDRRGEGNRLGNLAVAYYCLGALEQSENYFQQALAVRREVADRIGEVHDLVNLAEVLIDHNRLDGASSCIQKAGEVAPNHPFVHARRAQLAFSEKDDFTALKYYNLAIGLHAGEHTIFHFEHAMPLLRLRRTDKALNLIRERLAAFDHPEDLEIVLRRYHGWAEQEPGIAGLDEAIRLLEERAARSAASRDEAVGT